VATEIYRSNDIVVREERGYGSEACVVTFDAYTDTRDIDRPGFGEHYFVSRRIDAIHLLTRENDWYQYPEVPGVAAEVAARVQGYRRVVAYGHSMGAYAAIRFGGMAGASAALAISPQFSIDQRTAPFEKRWKYDSDRIDFTLERTLATPFVDTAVIAYDPHDDDRRHVEMFRRRTKVVDIRLPDVGHPATGSLAEAYVLDDLVQDFIADRLDVAEIERRVRVVNEASPQFHYVRSSRAFSRRARLAHAGRAAAMAPGHFGYVAHYASLLAMHGRYLEAQIALARAATLLPDHPVLLYKMADLHERRGDLEGAIEAAELLVSLHSETFRPLLDRLVGQRRRLASGRHWPALTIRGRRIIGDPALPIDVRVTTTPSPPPFVESWRLHEDRMARRPDGPFDVLLVGDSLAEFWPDALWSPRSVFNFGVRADKTQHTLWRLEQLPAGSLDCADAVVMLGTNNLGAGDTAAGIAAGVATAVAAVVRVAPRARVHVIATPPCGPDRDFRADVRRKANRMLAGLEGFETVDPDAALQTPGAYMDDGIHFTPEGYRRLAELVVDRLRPQAEATGQSAA
jgi:hypothetical protein